MKSFDESDVKWRVMCINIQSALCRNITDMISTFGGGDDINLDRN